MKKIALIVFLMACISCDKEPNIFNDITSKGGFVLFQSSLNPLHDISGDETVISNTVTDPNDNALKYELFVEKVDGTLTESMVAVTSFPGNILVTRTMVLSALGLENAEDLPQNITFIGGVTTPDGFFSGQAPNFNTTTNTQEGGNTYYEGLADIPGEAMKFSMVMFQLIPEGQIATFSILTENDDVEEIIADNGEGGTIGEMDLSSSDLEIGELSGGQGIVGIGLRFNFVGLPQGATITSAKVQFQVDNAGSGPVEMIIYGENTGNSEAFTSDLGNLTSRNYTSSSVIWEVPEWASEGEQGTDQQTVDFSEVLQEIVNRSDWVPGNSISIIMLPYGDSLNASSTSGGREAEAGVGDDSAKLLLSYTN
ncbi:MAG: hypothetical protein ACK5NB_13420 [Flavobacteriaceae bacterium]